MGDNYTYLNDLFDEVMNSTIGENLTLRCHGVEQNVERSVLVGTCSLIESTKV